MGRIVLLALAMSLAAAVGCDGPISDPTIDDTTAEIIGGAPTTAYPAVGMLTTGVGACTGTLIADTVVLTAAHCIEGANNGTFSFGPGGQTGFDQQISVIDTFGHRYYDPAVIRANDIALVRLAEAPTGIQPMAFNVDPLDDSFLGAPVNVVGYGVTDGEAQTGAGTKRQVLLSIDDVTPEHIQLGDVNQNICQGDSGGPTILNDNGTDVVLAVSSFGSNACMNPSFVTRTDISVDDFLLEVLAAWSGPCPVDGNCVMTGCGAFPDPDCGTCGFNGICGTGCPNLDLDCPIGGFTGDSCNSNDDCESRHCVEGVDDPRVKYCSESCETADDCQSGLTLCLEDAESGENLCFFQSPTPGSQGASCDDGSDCRSGVCHPDDDICIEQCGDGLPECPDGFECQSFGGSKGCLIPSGGCGCRASSPGGSAAALALLALLGLAWISRKRR